jgi:ParB/RepB/Spo0J family partition protein
MSRNTTECRVRDILLSEIDRSRNYRIPMPGDAERIESLKASIEACGQLQPVRVYERGAAQKHGKRDLPYILGFGARRCAAMERLGRKTIRAMVFTPASDAEIAQARAVENLHRQDITPLEEVQAVADVLEAIKAEEKFKGDAYEETATRLARSVAWVKDRDYLHRLTKAVQRFALQSGLPAGHLRELAKVGDPTEQMRLACESAGAPYWCFPAHDKDYKVADHHQETMDRYLGELADGKVERWPLSRLKANVAKVQLSLKVIPWEFEKVVEHGDMKLRKCAGCPHNSETDRTLFGIDEDAGNPRGFCLNRSCYDAKYQAAEAIKEQVLKKMSKRQVRTPEAIRKSVPPWLKASSVTAFVQRQLQKAEKHDNGHGKPKHRPGNGQVQPAHRGRPLTAHELTLRKFINEFGLWQRSAYTVVMAGINAQPVYRVSWCVLLGVETFWNHPRVEMPYINEYGPPCKEEPSIPLLSEELEKVIGLAFKGTRNAWLELLADEVQADPDQRLDFDISHPRVLELIADAVEVELPPVPQWTPPTPPAAVAQAVETVEAAQAVAA